MHYESELIEATIEKRYKRFLSDITLKNGEQVTAHVPNTGSMKTCWEPGWKAYLSKSQNPKRKLPYTLELTHNGESFISLNTSATNKIVKEALEKGLIKELKEFDQILPEQKIFDSRIDFMLKNASEKAFVEVKNVTLKQEKGVASFPDAVTTRGQKHLRDLIKIKEQGDRAVMLYVINRSDVSRFVVAKQIDPTYAKLLKEAEQKGVEILTYQTKISPQEIIISKKIPYSL